MPKLLDRQIGKLRDLCVGLGQDVDDSVRRAVRSVQDRDLGLAREVIAGDDEIDVKEVDLEEECLKVLALYQPVAVDLRYIIAVLKITSDLERIGDLAANIAERVLHMADADPLPSETPLEIGRMTDLALGMLRGALDSLVESDAQQAREVYHKDDVMDALHLDNHNHLEEAIVAQPDAALPLMRYVAISRFLERIADHATNIAEDVIYLLEGEIVRHRLEVPSDL